MSKVKILYKVKRYLLLSNLAEAIIQQLRIFFILENAIKQKITTKYSIELAMDAYVIYNRYSVAGFQYVPEEQLESLKRRVIATMSNEDK